VDYSKLFIKELRQLLDSSPTDPPDWEHAFAEVQVRAILAQRHNSILLAVFSGVVAISAVVQAFR
jgi:hypothetical protein